ncbi:SNO glutamine amidotransferase [Pluteus cervinus]|uniref:SNO glutamine amidotransferase n=1 Tax=Pluteus cervinus TaxID=181527 RepID=A0ACD3AND2_9AGAR|nr:SNO glutamine amidotransferase [Pluteus cervinus]
MAAPTGRSVTIGVLALQGAFIEHQAILQKLNIKRALYVPLVRTVEDLEVCDGLIIPGGESTTIALLARLSGLLEPLREFVKTKPVWGTCAGAILLAHMAEGKKKGGQELLGGTSVKIARNGWGSQVESFAADLKIAGLRNANIPFKGVFIRAPVILDFSGTSSNDPPAQVLARLPSDLLPPSLTDSDHPDDPKTVVALRQGLHLVTTFHPELTEDSRFHEYFVKECLLPTIKHSGPTRVNGINGINGGVSGAPKSLMHGIPLNGYIWR